MKNAIDGLEYPETRNAAHSFSTSVARGLAAFFGVFSLLNIVGSLGTPGFDASHWWIRLDALGHSASRLLLVMTALFLIAFACNPQMARWRRSVTAALTLILCVTAIANAVTFYVLGAEGVIFPTLWIPLSLFVAVALAFIFRGLYVQPGSSASLKNLGIPLAMVCGCALIFPACHMLFFGETDYRRKADAAVVFGCRAYADGRPSDALADRVRTACALYRDGTVRKLLFSGGPGDGAVHETEAMRRMAVALGVSATDIILDRTGLDTQATVRNTRALFREHGFRRVLAVSHFFHLPRIKMAYQRQGVEVYTVPARESYVLRQMPFLVARETAAWWVYYARPLYSGGV